MYALRVSFPYTQASQLALCGLGAVFVLAACTPTMSAGVASVRSLFGGAPAEAVKLDPSFAYLRVTYRGHTTFVWRGSVERSGGEEVEVYYSGGGEVLRLRAGRLVGVSGLATEWRRVVEGVPSWGALLQAPRPVAFVRERDVMPRYRSGVRDELVIGRTTPPERSALRGVDPRALTWFEERAQRASGFAGMPSDVLPPARYALDTSGASPVVVYAEQCLAPDLCLSWQRWTAAMQQASAEVR